MVSSRLETRPERLTVFVVDDDPGMRKSLQMVMTAAGLRMIGYDSAEGFLASYDPSQPGCVVLDMHMPGLDGTALIEALRERDWRIPVLVVTGTATVRQAVRTMKLGAVDFLEKPVPHRTLLEKVHSALALDIERRRREAEVAQSRAKIETLTERERELLDLLVAGQSNKQVASQLHISVKTVENHRANIMLKMEAANAAELVRMTLAAA